MANKLISVHFVDCRTGAAFGHADVLFDQLPVSFAPATRLQIGDADWEVVVATPDNAADISIAGSLILELSPIESVSPRDILFSLPTICGQMPEVEESGGELAAKALRLHEDVWRQVEFVSEGCEAEIDGELRSIRAIHEDSSVDGGEFRVFRNLHVRRRLASPIEPGITLEALREHVGLEHEPRALGPLESEALVKGGFAIGVTDAVTLYGIEADGQVAVLGLCVDGVLSAGPARTVARTLSQMMEVRGLFLVDWCRCFAVGPDAGEIAEYLSD